MLLARDQRFQRCASQHWHQITKKIPSWVQQRTPEACPLDSNRSIHHILAGTDARRHATTFSEEKVHRYDCISAWFLESVLHKDAQANLQIYSRVQLSARSSKNEYACWGRESFEDFRDRNLRSAHRKAKSVQIRPWKAQVSTAELAWKGQE